MFGEILVAADDFNPLQVLLGEEETGNLPEDTDQPGRVDEEDALHHLREPVLPEVGPQLPQLHVAAHRIHVVGHVDGGQVEDHYELDGPLARLLFLLSSEMEETDG